MTLEKAKKLLAVQADFGGFYNANGAKLILAEVQREHGQAAVDALIRELEIRRLATGKKQVRLTTKDAEVGDAFRLLARCARQPCFLYG
jgi:hypothetical protein